MSVSCVVNVLLATMNSAVSGFSFRSVSAMCVPSTLETKWTCRSRLPYGLSASVAMTGPRSEPPMPMLTTSVIALAGVAGPRAAADGVAELAHVLAARR